ncbi:hypothetical protein GTH32_00525 [Alteromonas sp. 345S023]|uniref:Tyrosine specific protein phosphatases domain-containing protein n=1 Tax=Alteromonas profundi TaxID=2696062 RepID=A0A7X5LHY2_9ALTE|nr:hypothetical protein [Alteromonas profundi]
MTETYVNTNLLNEASSERPALAWFSLSAGKICLGGKPTDESYQKLKSLGVTHLATVQTGEEQAPVIRDKAHAAGLAWLWVPFTSPGASSSTDDVHLHQYLHELSQMLQEGASIYLHCDGTGHRCSLLFYALCHYCRLPSNSAYSALHSFGHGAANHLPRADLSWAASLGHEAPKA